MKFYVTHFVQARYISCVEADNLEDAKKES